MIILKLLLLYFTFIYSVTGFDTCQDTIMLTSETVQHIENHNNNVELIQKLSTSMVKVPGRGQQVCFVDSNNTAKYGIKILEKYDVCTKMELLYYIPKNIAISCYRNTECNWFNQKSEYCESPKEEDFLEHFPELRKKRGNVIDKNCQVIPSSCALGIANQINWWYSEIYNDRQQNDIDAYYKVYKCSSSYKETIIEINVLNDVIDKTKNMGINPIKQILTIKDTTQSTLTTQNLNISISVTSSIDTNINVLEKCYLIDNNNRIAIIDSCNDPSDNVVGKIGEIKCFKAKDAITMVNCTHEFRMEEIYINGDTISCKLNSLNAEKIFNEHLLPKQFKGYEVSLLEKDDDESYSENEDHFLYNVKIKHDVENIVLDLTTKFRPEMLKNTGLCSIEATKKIVLSGNLVEFRKANFSLRVKSDDHFIVSFDCNDNLDIQDSLTNPSTQYVEQMFYFDPNALDINSRCKVFCNNKYLFMTKIYGKFREDNLQEFTNIFTGNIKSIAQDIDKGFFPVLQTMISNFITKIVVAVVCLLIIVCLIIKIFRCLCNQTFCCLRKIKKSNDIEIESFINHSKTRKTKKETNFNKFDITTQTYNALDQINIKHEKPSLICYTMSKQQIIFKYKFKIAHNGIFDYNTNNQIIKGIPGLLFFTKDFNVKDCYEENNLLYITTLSNVTILKHDKVKQQLVLNTQLYQEIDRTVYKKTTNEKILIISSNFFNFTKLSLVDNKNYKIKNNSLYNLKNEILIHNIFLS